MFDSMNDWDTGQAISLSVLLLFILLGSAGLQTAGFGKSIKMALTWVTIFAAVFVIAVYRDDLRSRLSGEFDPAGGSVSGKEFRIRARDDGHFWVRGTVNGEIALFLVDTGASDIVLTHATARRIGTDLSALRYDGIAVTVSGAVRTGRVPLKTIEIGPILRGPMRASVGERDSGANLLGMAFLKTLRGWRVEGETLILLA